MSTDFATLLPWVIAHGYFLFLIMAIIEGPIVTVAAGTAAALGYYNIFIIALLAIAGDLGGDFLYYGIGYYSRNLISHPIFRFIGLTEKRIGRMETLLHSHTRKAILLIKLSPLVGPVGLMIIGAARPPFRKFFEMAAAIGIPKSIFFALIGFYSGKAYVHFTSMFEDHQYVLPILLLIIAIVYLVYRKVTGKVTEEIEEI